MAWRELLATHSVEKAAEDSILAPLFAAVGVYYEGADPDHDHPVTGILRGAIDQIHAWGCRQTLTSMDMVHARVSYADLYMLERRLEAAMALMKLGSLYGGRLGGAR
jgi:hypothetical protein